MEFLVGLYMFGHQKSRKNGNSAFSMAPGESRDFELPYFRPRSGSEKHDIVATNH